MPRRDTQNSTDHDLLITLNTKFDVFLKEWQSVRDSFNSRLSAVETRIATTENTMRDLAVAETVKKADESHDWIHDYKLRWKTILGIVSAISTAIGVALTLLIQLWGGRH